MKKLSITLRVTLWYTLLMLVLIVLVIAMLLATNETATGANLQALLKRVVDENADEVEYEGRALDIDDDFAYYADGVVSLVYDETGTLLAGELPARVEVPAFSDREVRILTLGGSRWGVYDRQVSDEKRHHVTSSVWVRGMIRVDALDSTTGPVLRFALIALPLWLCLAAGIGYLLAKRAFRPVQAIQREAEAIAGGEDLSRRIDLGAGEDEIHRLAETINGMLSRLEASFDAERQFTADASHELRTPAAVILSQAEYALSHAESTETYRESLEAIEQQAQRMSRLIAQLLAFTRMEQGAQAMALEETDISELTTFVIEEQRDLAPQTVTISGKIQPGLCATVDRTLYTRALGNLIGNAVQHGKPEGAITVALSLAGDKVLVSVQDDGPGIAPENLPRIWNRFYRADSARTGDEKSHTGLGLSMVRQIMLLHGGKAQVQSTPGQGSTFTLVFPQKGKRLS